MSERCQTPSEEQVILRGSQREKPKTTPSKQLAPPTGRGGAYPESQWEATSCYYKGRGLPEGAARVLRSRSHRPSRVRMVGRDVSASSLSLVLTLVSLIVRSFLWGHHYNELNLLWNLLGRQAQGKLCWSTWFCLSSSFNPVFIPFNEIPHANSNQTENIMNINEI